MFKFVCFFLKMILMNCPRSNEEVTASELKSTLNHHNIKHLTNTLKNLIQSSSASQSPAQNFYIILRNHLSQIPRHCNGHFRISSFSVCLKQVPLSKFCTHTFITSSMSYINGFCPKLASTTSPGVWSPTVGYKFGCAKNKQGKENNYV